MLQYCSLQTNMVEMPFRMSTVILKITERLFRNEHSEKPNNKHPESYTLYAEDDSYEGDEARQDVSISMLTKRLTQIF